MAGKKQKRMERDPSLDATGKPKKKEGESSMHFSPSAFELDMSEEEAERLRQRLFGDRSATEDAGRMARQSREAEKAKHDAAKEEARRKEQDRQRRSGSSIFDNISVKIDIDDLGVSGLTYAEMRRFVKRFQRRPGGRIFIDGVGEIGGFGITERRWEDIVSDKEGRDATSEMIMAKAMQIWKGHLGWRFSVTYNPGDFSIWFTAEFLDDEADEPLVKMSIEFSERTMSDDLELDEVQLEVERMLTELHDKCQAELAMFE